MEDQAVEEKTFNLLADWEKEKPTAGNVRPDQALNTLAIMEGRFVRLKDERDKIQKAKEALELVEAGRLK